jgi:hypothetical protein
MINQPQKKPYHNIPKTNLHLLLRQGLCCLHWPRRRVQTRFRNIQDRDPI